MKKAKVPKEPKKAKEPKPKIEKPITDAQKKKLEKCVEKLTKKIEDAGGGRVNGEQDARPGPGYIFMMPARGPQTVHSWNSESLSLRA